MRSRFSGSGSWTSLVGFGLQKYVAGRARKLADTGYWKRHSTKIQIDTLRSLLSRAAETKFGRSHGFSAIARCSSGTVAITALRFMQCWR